MWAYGIWSMVCHELAPEQVPLGDIGRYSDIELAEELLWPEDRDAKELVDAMVEAELLDRSKKFRLIIHDWPSHCEDSVHAKVARARKLFANGEKPKLTKLQDKERESAFTYYSNLKPEGRRKTGGIPPAADILPQNTNPPLPSQALPNQAIPLPSHSTQPREDGGDDQEPEGLKTFPPETGPEPGAATNGKHKPERVTPPPKRELNRIEAQLKSSYGGTLPFGASSAIMLIKNGEPSPERDLAVVRLKDFADERGVPWPGKASQPHEGTATPCRASESGRIVNANK